MAATPENSPQSTTPLVSVIIPCYNQGQYLDDAIHSVLDQNYPNIEIIVIDDGSRDNTRERATSYSQVQYIYQSNQGISAARNTGMCYSKGELLVFLDADDRLLKTAVSTNALIMQADLNLAFAAGHYRYVSADGIPTYENKPHGITNDYYLMMLRGNYIGMHAAVMYRRDVLEAVGGFNPRLRSCEDYDVYLRITQNHPVVCHDTLIAEYRRHGSGLSNNSSLMLQTALATLATQLPYVRNQADPRYIAAYRRGQHTWRNLYGRELMLSTLNAARSNQWYKAGKNLLLLLPLIPGAIVWLTRRSINRAYLALTTNGASS